jgi:hypothetical protein
MKYFLNTSRIRDKQIKFVKNQQSKFFEKQLGFVEDYKVMKYFDRVYDKIDEQFCRNVKKID